MHKLPLIFALLLACTSARPFLKSRYFLHVDDFIQQSDREIPLDVAEMNVVEEVRMELEELQHGSKPVESPIVSESPHAPSSATDVPQIDEDDDLSTLYFWFALHDETQDGKLDGYELLQAFGQWGHSNDNHNLLLDEDVLTDGHLLSSRQKQKLLVSMSAMVDKTLAEDDTNKDGAIDVQEFLASQVY